MTFITSCAWKLTVHCLNLNYKLFQVWIWLKTLMASHGHIYTRSRRHLVKKLMILLGQEINNTLFINMRVHICLDNAHGRSQCLHYLLWKCSFFFRHMQSWWLLAPTKHTHITTHIYKTVWAILLWVSHYLKGFLLFFVSNSQGGLNFIFKVYSIQL